MFLCKILGRNGLRLFKKNFRKSTEKVCVQSNITETNYFIKSLIFNDKSLFYFLNVFLHNKLVEFSFGLLNNCKKRFFREPSNLEIFKIRIYALALKLYTFKSLFVIKWILFYFSLILQEMRKSLLQRNHI